MAFRLLSFIMVMLMRAMTGALVVKSCLLPSISVAICFPSETDSISVSFESRLVLGYLFAFFFFYLCKSMLKTKGLTRVLLSGLLILVVALSFFGDDVNDSLSNSKYSPSFALLVMKYPQKARAKRAAKSKVNLAS